MTTSKTNRTQLGVKRAQNLVRTRPARLFLTAFAMSFAMSSNPVWAGCAMPQPGMTLWIPGDTATGNITPSLVGPDATMYGAIIQGSGHVLSTLGIAKGDYLQIPNGSSVKLGEGDFSVDFWIKNQQPNMTVSILDSRFGGVGGNPTDSNKTGQRSPSRSLQAANKKSQRFPTKSLQTANLMSGSTGVHIFLHKGKLGLQLAHQGTSRNFTSSQMVADSIWHHVILVVDRDSTSGIHWYVDGMQAPSAEVDPTAFQNKDLSHSGAIAFGKQLGKPARLRALLDEFTVYDRALHPAEARKLFEGAQAGMCKDFADKFKHGDVVFASDRNGGGIFVADLSNGPANPTIFTVSQNMHARHPSWSRNGKYIVYVYDDLIPGPGSAWIPTLEVVDISNGYPGSQVYWGQPGSYDNYGYPRFSHDDQHIIFSAWNNWDERVVLSIPSPGNGGSLAQLTTAGSQFVTPFHDTWNQVLMGGPKQTIHIANNFSPPIPLNSQTLDASLLPRSHHPSVSPNGDWLLTNSERYKDGVPGYFGEEVEMTLRLGPASVAPPINATQAPGHQLGFFALNGNGEFVYESKNNGNSTTSQLFLQYGPFMTELNVDTNDEFNDGYPHWLMP